MRKAGLTLAIAGADTSALERELDELVNALCGLPADEIKLVEESIQK